MIYSTFTVRFISDIFICKTKRVYIVIVNMYLKSNRKIEIYELNIISDVEVLSKRFGVTSLPEGIKLKVHGKSGSEI